MNEMPIQQYYALPYDRWEGYEAERQELLRQLQKREERGLPDHRRARDARERRTPQDARGAAAPENSGIFDVTVGPAATANFGLEIDEATGQPGSRRARGLGVLHAAAAQRRRHAVLDRRPVQLRAGQGDPEAADDHAEGHRRAGRRQDGARPCRRRAQLPALRVKLSVAVIAALAALLVAAPLAQAPHGAAGLLRRDVRPRRDSGAGRRAGRCSGT